jgi:hypothetical protein
VQGWQGDEGSLAAKPREQDLQLYWSEVKAFWYLPLVHVWHTVDEDDAYCPVAHVLQVAEG